MSDPFGPALTLLIAHLSHAVLVEDADGRVRDCNAACQRLCMVDQGSESLRGTDATLLRQQLASQLREPEAFAAQWDQMAGADAPVTGATLQLTKGRQLEWDCLPVMEAGRLMGRIWTFRDVTPQSEAAKRADRLQQFYERVLDAMPAQLAVFDARTLRYRYVTPSAIRDPQIRSWIIGHTDREYAAYRGFDPSVADRRRSMIAEAARSKVQTSWEESLTTASGEVRHFARFVTPVLDADGESELVLGYGLDITDRKRIEEQLRDATRAAEASAQAKENFLANMSHEIRTPLNAVVGTTHLLESTPLDTLQRRYLGAIRHSTDTLLSLINDILDLTKIGSGNLEFESAPFRIQELVESLGETLQASALQKGIGITVTVDPAVPPVVVGDARRLNQILLNLVGNAVKFTPEGTVTLAVHAEAAEGDAYWLVCRVTDTGVGIAADKQHIIFDAFAQERSDTTRRFGGTGLGLTIVRELVTRQGGRITVDSTVGVGSTFTVALPVRTGHMPMALPMAVDKRGRVGLAGKRILLVEDNEMNQFVATEILARAGAVVVVEGHGRAAVERLRMDQAFDLILMDIQMPEMDGFEATRIIRNDLGIDPESIPILALTASALLEQQRRARELGMNDFVTKPFDPVHLVRRVALAVQQEGRTPMPTPMTLAAIEAEAPTLTLLPMVDRAVLEAQAMGDFALVVDVLDVCLHHLPGQYRAIREAEGVADRARLCSAAHSMRSAMGAVGAKAISALLFTLEYESVAFSDEDQAAFMRDLDTAVREVVTTLTALREDYAQRVAGGTSPAPASMVERAE
ncbi:MAG: ATP-binding protein [Gemmatimonadaceae bacterium]